VALLEPIGAFSVTLAAGRIQQAGPYEICGVAPGTFRLQSHRVSFKPLEVQGYRSIDVVVAEQNVDAGYLEPLSPGELRGTLTVRDGKSGEPVPAGIRVRRSTAGWNVLNLVPSAAVQADGTFVMPNMFAEDYSIRVESLPAAHYVIDASQRGRSVLEGGLRLGDGDVEIKLGADGAVVGGRVLTADDVAILDASVILVPKGPGRPLVAHSDQAGTYLFAYGVQPGEYRLVAASGLTEWQEQDNATIALLAAGGTELRLGPRESRTVDLRVRLSP
jgi:hypothetical protein